MMRAVGAVTAAALEQHLLGTNIQKCMVYIDDVVCRVSTRDDLKLMDVGAGKAAMSKVVPGFPSTVRYGVCTMYTFVKLVCITS